MVCCVMLDGVFVLCFGVFECMCVVVCDSGVFLLCLSVCVC